MSNDKKQNLQDTFLNSVRKSKTPLTIFLVNGVKLQGVVTWFDNFCVLLRRDGQSQLVYKHAISTIMPAQPVQLYEPATTTRTIEPSKIRSTATAAAGPDARLVIHPDRAPARGRAPRDPDARLEEAVGLALALDLEVARGRGRAAAQAHARHPVRQGQGRGDRPPWSAPPRPTSSSSTTP